MKTISKPEISGRVRRAVTSTLGAAALAIGVLAPAASASTTPPLPAAGPTSLSIVSETARLVGAEALVSVRCEGPRNGFCSGTLQLSLAGVTREAPFSVSSGSRQSLDVSLGHGLAARARSAVAVARTAQASGGSIQSRAVLHFRQG